MMRNISFMHTTQQFKTRTKTVTRRTGWRTLKAGDELCAVEKRQGLERGEKVVRLGHIKVTDVRREPLRRMLDDLDYGLAETTREGFPSGDPLHSPSEFVEFFCRTHKGCTPHSEGLTLLAELRRRAPEAIDWAAMGDVVPLLDAFEAAMESKTARRH